MGKRVLVFPTCRIASNNLVFSDTGFEWKASDKKLEQPVQTEEDDEGEEQNPTPDFTSVKYAKNSPEIIPTPFGLLRQRVKNREPGNCD